MVAKISPLVILEFDRRTIRVSRSVIVKSMRSFLEPRRIVTHCFSFPCPEPVEGPSGDSQEDLHKIIQLQLKHHKIKAENVILSLPRHKAISHLLKLPTQDSQEAGDMVALHVSREGSYNRDNEMISDYHIVHCDINSGSLVRVLCMQKKHIKKYLEIVEKINICPMRITVNTQGLLNWLSLQNNHELNHSKRCSFLLNVDDGVFDFIVIFKGSSIFSRSFIMPEEKFINISQWLDKELKVSFEVFRRMAAGTFEYDDEIYIFSPSTDSPSPDIGGFISSQIKNLKPSKRLEVKSNLKYLTENAGVSYASVLGLALKEEERGIDITPSELHGKAQEKKHRRILKGVTVLLTATLLCFSLFLLRLIDLKSNEYASAKVQLSSSTSLEKAAANSQRLALLDMKVSGSNSPLDVLQKLYGLVPASIFVLDLDIQEDELLSLTGFGKDIVSVFNFLQVLEKSSFFKDPQLKYVNAREGDSALTFKIISSIETYANKDKNSK